jgi:hypothetical protein
VRAGWLLFLPNVMLTAVIFASEQKIGSMYAKS